MKTTLYEFSLERLLGLPYVKEFKRTESLTECDTCVKGEKAEQVKVFINLGRLFTNDAKRDRDTGRRVSVRNKVWSPPDMRRTKFAARASHTVCRSEHCRKIDRDQRALAPSGPEYRDVLCPGCACTAQTISPRMTQVESCIAMRAHALPRDVTNLGSMRMTPKLDNSQRSRCSKMSQTQQNCHTSAERTRFSEGQKIELTDHPPYSPDLAPNDVYLFPSVKNKLRGQRFSSR
ncbi:hypothetical protein EVAR_12507_1 [Eumeta japonica]|uniref:Histone-lysine N-methyltransferase SETMAR n=1 Tax=Eumeta variegata TaxID=151549 RepID=A0A4C1TPL2_EUMVA|nr:hypothetical protein EVAR_12507_1 [Eumeta japonica]